MLSSGFVSSVVLIAKSVCSKFPSKNVSKELKKLSLTCLISANEIVAKESIKTNRLSKKILKNNSEKQIKNLL